MLAKVKNASGRIGIFLVKIARGETVCGEFNDSSILICMACGSNNWVKYESSFITESS